MRSEWELNSLKKYITHKKGFAFKSKDYELAGIPIVKVTNLTSDSIDMSGVVYVNSEIAEANKSVSLTAGDIIITTVGSWATNPASVVGKTIKVPLEAEGALLNQNAVIIRPKDDSLDKSFLYYLFKNSSFSKYLIGNAQGSANQASITLNDIYSYETYFPQLSIQKKIAHILSTLDDKIELNRKMNETLEAMAQAMFKSWFVDFDPVHAKAKASSDAELEKAAAELGISKAVLELFPSTFVESEMGMIPEGWEVSTIEDEVIIYGGATPSTKEEKYWIDGDNHWATPRDLSGLNSKILIDTGRKITDDGVNKISSKQLPIGTILLSSRAPVGYIAYSTIPISINQGFIAMVCKKRLSNYSIMYWLDIAMNEIKNRAIGTTFSEISKSAFRPIKLVVASDDILKAFDVIVASMVKKLIENEREIETLKQTRDTLLPKLLSGELDVSEVEVK